MLNYSEVVEPTCPWKWLLKLTKPFKWSRFFKSSTKSFQGYFQGWKEYFCCGFRTAYIHGWKVVW